MKSYFNESGMGVSWVGRGPGLSHKTKVLPNSSHSIKSSSRGEDGCPGKTRGAFFSLAPGCFKKMGIHPHMFQNVVSLWIGFLPLFVAGLLTVSLKLGKRSTFSSRCSTSTLLLYLGIAAQGPVLLTSCLLVMERKLMFWWSVWSVDPFVAVWQVMALCSFLKMQCSARAHFHTAGLTVLLTPY